MSGYTIGEIVVWLAITAVLGFALGWLSRELVQRRRHRLPVAQPAPDAVTEPVTEPVPEPEPELVLVAGPHPGSALPLADGAQPSPEFVVKVSRGSKIFHAPTSPAYARTSAAMWFRSAEDAEAAGFRKPKNA